MEAQPTDSPDPIGDPMEHVRAVVGASGTSFFWAMRVLPEEKRDAMFAVYAFCREVDDIADEEGDEADKRHRLGLWRGQIERLYAGSPTYPTARALIAPLETFGLEKGDFRAVIDGMEMDAGPRMRIKDMAELELYCDRVACAVGRLSNRVFGLDKTLGDQLAFALGNALQLTNILRDVEEDAERDRLYLPRDLLVAHGIEDPDDLSAVLAHPGLEQVCELLADIAARRFEEADGIIRRCDAETVRPATMMRDVYQGTFRKLRRRGWRAPRERVRLGKVAKLWIAFRHMLRVA